MIHRMIVFNFKAEVTEEEIEEHFRQESELHKLPFVAEARHWKVMKAGNPRVREDLDYATIVSFADDAAAEEYRVHPQHKAFREKWADRLIDQTNPFRCQFVER